VGKATEQVLVRINSDPAELPQVREEVRRVSVSAGFAEADVARLVLAVDEAIANVIKHGYEGRHDQPVEVQLCCVEEKGCCGVKCVVRDFGKQVPPETICGRCLDDVRPGGLGVHIIRSVMDRVCYAPARGGGMQLEMIKLNTP
jgi:anti-sigma regulatory factor (Ser/Thr protein kinase)